MTTPREALITDSDLHDVWTQIVGEPGFARRTLWFIFIDPNDRPLDIVVPIEGIPEEVDLLGVGNLLAGLRSSYPDLAFAAMLSRPGSLRVRESDIEWARAVTGLLEGPSRRWPMHLATDDGIRVFAPDDLVLSQSA